MIVNNQTCGIFALIGVTPQAMTIPPEVRAGTYGKDPLVAEMSLDLECSALAKDTCATAHEVAERQPKGGVTQGYFIVGRPDFPNGKRAKVSLLNQRIGFEGRGVELAVVEPIRDEDGMIQYSRRNWRGQKRVVTGIPQRPDGPIFLAAVIDNFVCLPLAGFERRETGTCHFVQLGSEMEDDAYFTTILDEKTSRFDYVQQILEVLQHSLVNRRDGHSLDRDEVGLIEKLAAHEAQRRQDELLDAKAAHLVQSAYFKALYAKERATIQVIDQAEGTFESQPVNYQEIGFRSVLDDGRIIRLAIATDPGWTENDPIELLALTRGELALPLATFQRTDGSIIFHGQAGEVDDGRRGHMLQELAAIFEFEDAFSVRRGVFWDTLRSLDDRMSQRPPHHTYLLAEICGELGLFRKTDLILPALIEDKQQAAHKTYLFGQGIADAKAVRDYFRRAGSGEVPFKNDKIMQMAIRAMRDKQSIARSLAETFGVASRLQTALGECTPEEELLVEELHWMAQQRAKFSGVIGGALLGRHRTEMFYEATVEPGDLNYALRLSAMQAVDRELPADLQLHQSTGLDLRVHETIDLRRPVRESWSLRSDVSEWIGSVLHKLQQLQPEPAPSSGAVDWPISYLGVPTFGQWYNRQQ